MKVLLHDCCAPCGAHVATELKNNGYDVTVYFYNPNIFPEEEYRLRLAEMKRFCQDQGIGFIEATYERNDWKLAVEGLENEPERGKRCAQCFTHRLSESAQKAHEFGAKAFATTLTMSPLKDAALINRIGREIADIYDLEFLDTVWRENGGDKLASALSKKYDFHRQNYCGCEFAMRNDERLRD
jgi:predicted adenine nucleotide alpha hydrolase (AANH) superfamily ATPase